MNPREIGLARRRIHSNLRQTVGGLAVQFVGLAAFRRFGAFFPFGAYVLRSRTHARLCSKVCLLVFFGLTSKSSK